MDLQAPFIWQIAVEIKTIRLWTPTLAQVPLPNSPLLGRPAVFASRAQHTCTSTHTQDTLTLALTHTPPHNTHRGQGTAKQGALLKKTDRGVSQVSTPTTAGTSAGSPLYRLPPIRPRPSRYLALTRYSLHLPDLLGASQ
jgi:hypothetical protein